MRVKTPFVAALFIVPAAVLLTWAWFTAARTRAELRSFSGFDGLRFDI